MSDEDVFLEAMEQMPPEYLRCRSMRHAWDEEEGFTIVDTVRETSRRARGGERVFAERKLTCLRCGMERSDAYQITKSRGHTALRKLSSSYPVVPDGYYVKGAGRLGMELVLGAKFDRDTAEAPTKRKRRA